MLELKYHTAPIGQITEEENLMKVNLCQTMGFSMQVTCEGKKSKHHLVMKLGLVIRVLKLRS